MVAATMPVLSAAGLVTSSSDMRRPNLVLPVLSVRPMHPTAAAGDGQEAWGEQGSVMLVPVELGLVDAPVPIVVVVDPLLVLLLVLAPLPPVPVPLLPLQPARPHAAIAPTPAIPRNKFEKRIRSSSMNMPRRTQHTRPRLPRSIDAAGPRGALRPAGPGALGSPPSVTGASGSGLPPEAAEIVQAMNRLDARGHVHAGDGGDLARADRFDAERGGRGRVDHRPAQGHGRELGLARQVADEAARERVAGAGRVHHVLEREAGRGEDAELVEEERAVLALLDDEPLRPATEDDPRRLADVVLPGELARLLVVDDEDVDAPQHLADQRRFAGDPEVHGVGDHEARALHLAEHVDLQGRVDVAEEHDGRGPVRRGDLRAELREHVELRVERSAVHEVGVVTPGPAERAARRALHP